MKCRDVIYLDTIVRLLHIRLTEPCSVHSAALAGYDQSYKLHSPQTISYNYRQLVATVPDHDHTDNYQSVRTRVCIQNLPT